MVREFCSGTGNKFEAERTINGESFYTTDYYFNFGF